MAEAVRLEEAGRKRRAARMRLLAERGERQRQAARALRRRDGRREGRGRRRREQGAVARAAATGAGAGSGRVRKRRRRVIESESDSDSGSDDDERARQLGGAVPATLTAGRLTRGAGASGAGDSAGFSFLSGSGGERHQAAVAEARRHLGGGGKRGWPE